jgi:hypothetical protein
MDKKTTGVIAVIVTSVLCGLPGLAGLCIGPLAIFGSQVPDGSLDQADANLALGMGIAMLCLSIIFIAIPIVVGFLTLGERKKKIADIGGPIPEDDF